MRPRSGKGLSVPAEMMLRQQETLKNALYNFTLVN